MDWSSRGGESSQEGQSSVVLTWLRAGARTGMVILGIVLVVSPFLTRFCPIIDTSDTSGAGAGLACALVTIGFLYLGQSLVIIGSLVPPDHETRVPLLPGLPWKQRRLVVAAVLIQVAAIVVGLVDIPLIELVGVGVWLPSYFIGWSLIIAAWAWMVVDGLPTRNQ